MVAAIDKNGNLIGITKISINIISLEKTFIVINSGS
jgi:hypothetical protein